MKPTLGSFNQIPVTSFFDFVVAMGALHHSTNLLRTLQECAKALKPGGFLIAQEPASEDSATNEEFLARYTAFETFYNADYTDFLYWLTMFLITLGTWLFARAEQRTLAQMREFEAMLAASGGDGGDAV